MFLGFIEHLKIESQEYKELSERIANELIEPLKTVINAEKKEESLYKGFIALKKDIKNSKKKRKYTTKKWKKQKN